ncbi:MAG: CheR family methyltransferase [Candidatus Hodarchaeota archaeon]
MYSDTMNIDLIKQFLFKHGFTDISYYKPKYFTRRLATRMKKGKCTSYLEYYKKLKNDPEEINILRNSFSINVTSFFRDTETWDRFRVTLKDFLNKKKEQKLPSSINIWSAGCAIGAEPYSIAIMVHELLGSQLLTYEKNLKIYATDFNEELLSVARKGIFEGEVMRFVPSDILIKFFDPFGLNKGTFKIKYIIRKYVEFSYLDLTLFKHWKQNLDAIVCRNVLIYFSKDLQEQIIHKFYNHLLPGGLLLLGGTEILHSALRDSFEIISVKHKLYRKKIINSAKIRKNEILTKKEKKELYFNLKCSNCGVKFLRPIDLRIHERKKNCGKIKFRCKICRKEFKTRTRLNIHSKYFHRPL